MLPSYIKKLYIEFKASPNRREWTCLEPEGLEALLEAVGMSGGGNVLDLGSGLSSLVLRSLRANRPLAYKDLEVDSVDTSEHWLNVCRLELKELGLPFDNMFTYNQWKEHRQDRKYDLIFVDIGDTKFRKKILSTDVIPALNKKGLLLLDDYHMKHYSPEVNKILKANNFKFGKLQQHRDRFGRYMCLAREQR